MAVVAGSLGAGGSRQARRPYRAPLRPVPVAGLSVSHPARPGVPAGALRRLAGLAATFLVLTGVWVGAGALRGAENPPVGHPVVYVVRPGDTLWAIATRLDPAADPVEVVATLGAELHGAPLRPGAVLTVPAS
jgi:nucleoid-associated protein YgaU